MTRYLRFGVITAAVISAILLASVGRRLALNGLEVAILAMLLVAVAWSEQSVIRREAPTSRHLLPRKDT
jgi:hypothetical protein